jgi:hypothetical protein
MNCQAFAVRRAPDRDRARAALEGHQEGVDRHVVQAGQLGLEPAAERATRVAEDGDATALPPPLPRTVLIASASGSWSKAESGAGILSACAEGTPAPGAWPACAAMVAREPVWGR